MQNGVRTLEVVQEYYGKVLGNKSDLQTNACCTADSVSSEIKSILANIDDEILAKFYGCGSPIPEAVTGCAVLDLGCGTGRDAYVLSKLVGASGRVIGVDMTENQLEVARRHIDTQTKRFGYTSPNITFAQGYIEDLAQAGIADNSVDIVVSNCVVNLSPAKEQVFSEIFRVLKPGGELYFSDVFADRRIPEALAADEVLYGECLSGALYVEDFRRMMRRVGCLDFRVVSSATITVDNPVLEQKIGMINFSSLTVRAFKLESLEDRCEDFGQVAVYRGTVEGHPHRFTLDDHHTFYTGKPLLVCGNTAAMLEETRFASHFEIRGDRSTHFGLFDCTDDMQLLEVASGGACC
jgi:ubiquinone/menaquinone biosynthesis C-methylase UbiE